MGSEDIHHKNKDSVKQNRRKQKKARNLQSAQRKMGQLEFPKMLIMADDKKSIILYLKGFKISKTQNWHEQWLFNFIVLFRNSKVQKIF